MAASPWLGWLPPGVADLQPPRRSSRLAGRSRHPVRRPRDPPRPGAGGPRPCPAGHGFLRPRPGTHRRPMGRPGLDGRRVPAGGASLRRGPGLVRPRLGVRAAVDGAPGRGRTDARELAARARIPSGYRGPTGRHPGAPRASRSARGARARRRRGVGLARYVAAGRVGTGGAASHRDVAAHCRLRPRMRERRVPGLGTGIRHVGRMVRAVGAWRRSRSRCDGAGRCRR
jgi:hypothetical protein